jgi:2-oxoglutarate dehydrogenase E2 component (dihydrolipoamide succinyltransferase)
VEVESDKATQKIPAPSAGKITQLLKGAGDAADIGEVIALIDETVTAGAAPTAGGSDSPTAASNSEPAPAGTDSTRVMPAAARSLSENGLSADQVSATGPGGRLLKEDVQRHVAAASTAVAPRKSQNPSLPKRSLQRSSRPVPRRLHDRPANVPRSGSR